MKSYYEILEIEKDATQDEIKIAYKKKAKENHPDHGGDANKFVEVLEAYNTLKDPKKREEYDISGKKKTRTIYDLANKAVQMYFKKFLNTGDKVLETDVIQEILKLLGSDELRNKHEQKKIKKRIKVLEKLTKRIERKGNINHSPIEELLKSEIDDCQMKLNQTKFNSIVNGIVFQILQDYNLRRDVDG